MLQGCALLTFQSELVYRRIVDHIYTSDNKLFDDEITWQVLTAKFHADIDRIKAELTRKNKIYIKDGVIKNKGCDKWLTEAKLNHENQSKKGKKGANARWNNGTGNAQAMATTNHKPLTINHKVIKQNLFEEFWKIIRYKKGREGAWKSFKSINFEKEKFTHIELANLYNEYLDSLPDFQDTPKYVQGWLTDRRWLDEESLTPQTFAKKYNIDARFVKFENEIYYFETKESFGMMTWKYDKFGKMIRDGEKQERKT